MSSLYSNDRIAKPSSGSAYTFVFVAIALILVFVVLYYSYNFLFKTIGAPSPTTIISNARSTTAIGDLNTSFTPPYEGGDYTVSFWMYVNGNIGSTYNYRKHIVSIGGNTFSTLVVGLDGGTNNLIVRTHTGDGVTSGVSSTTSLATTSSAITGSSGSSRYVYGGGQTFFDATAINNAIRMDTSLACTRNGLIRRGDGANQGWSESCNPCVGYWEDPGSTAGTGLANLGWMGSDRLVATFRSYANSGSGSNPCRNVCVSSCDGTFSGAENRTMGTLGTSGTSSGTSGTSSGTSGTATCTWSRTTPTYPGCGRGSSSNTTTGSTPSFVPTISLSSSTTNSLFTSPVTSSSDLPPACDIPQYDLQRWTHITVVMSGKITDVYMNGKMARSCIGGSYFKVDVSPKVRVLNAGLADYKTFDGKLANLNLYTIALNPAQIYDMYTKGPTL